MQRLIRTAGVAMLLLGTASACGSDAAKTGTATTGGATTDAGAGGITVAAADGTPVAVTAGDKTDTEQFLTVAPVSVKAGKVTFTLENTGTRQHEMIVLKTDEAFDQLKIDAANKVSEDTSVGEISETDKGKTVTKTLDLAAGKYVLVCNIEKHYGQGMRSAFTVTP